MADLKLSDMERSSLQSKKFHAYLLAEFTWKIILGLMVYRWVDKRASVMIAVIIMAGFIECGYILGQAALDRYVRVTALLRKNGVTPEQQDSEVATGDAPEAPVAPEAPTAPVAPEVPVVPVVTPDPPTPPATTPGATG